MTTGGIFHVNTEMTTMTNGYTFDLERTLDELRREAKEAPTMEERRLIEAELEALKAELEKYASEQLP